MSSFFVFLMGFGWKGEDGGDGSKGVDERGLDERER